MTDAVSVISCRNSSYTDNRFVSVKNRLNMTVIVICWRQDYFFIWTVEFKVWQSIVHQVSKIICPSVFIVCPTLDRQSWTLRGQSCTLDGQSWTLGAKSWTVDQSCTFGGQTAVDNLWIIRLIFNFNWEVGEFTDLITPPNISIQLITPF